ncbi:hypothetical protein FJR37_15085 [Aphanizomenon sp. UHCC 0183]|nr:hypothetical protein [Aphanizomenon sp. UHCC 0183]
MKFGEGIASTIFFTVFISKYGYKYVNTIKPNCVKKREIAENFFTLAYCLLPIAYCLLPIAYCL